MNAKGLAIAALSIGIWISLAQAVPLNPGTTVYVPQVPDTPEYTSTLPSYFTLANQVDQMVAAYNAVIGNITGSVTSTVYRDPATNFLSFQYTFTNTGASDLLRATIGSPQQEWLGWNISDAGADGSGASTAGEVAPVWTTGDPFFLLRDPLATGAGVTIQWRVGSSGTRLAGPDDISSLIFFETNAPTYQLTNVGLINSGAVSSAQAFAPAPLSTIIPEPATIVLLGIGIFGAAASRRRR